MWSLKRRLPLVGLRPRGCPVFARFARACPTSLNARAALLISVLGVVAACHDDRARVDQFELALVETTRSANGDVASTVLDSNGKTVATMRWSQDVVVTKTAHEPDADLLPVESPTSLEDASRIAYRLWLGSR